MIGADTGMDQFKVLYGSGFKFDRTAIPAEVDGIVEKIEREYAEGKMLNKRPRILLTGCPVGGSEREGDQSNRREWRCRCDLRELQWCKIYR